VGPRGYIIHTRMCKLFLARTLQHERCVVSSSRTGTTQPQNHTLYCPHLQLPLYAPVHAGRQHAVPCYAVPRLTNTIPRASHHLCCKRENICEMSQDTIHSTTPTHIHSTDKRQHTGPFQTQSDRVPSDRSWANSPEHTVVPAPSAHIPQAPRQRAPSARPSPPAQQRTLRTRGAVSIVAANTEESSWAATQDWVL
jgi:hypothetical protein